MPIYKQYKYTKEIDCINCKYFKYNKCTCGIPNEFNCNYKTIKTFTKKYFFKTSILGRSFTRRGFKTKECARDAETKFREQLIDDNYLRTLRTNKTYSELFIEYGNYLKENLKATYSTDTIRKIKNYYSKLMPDIPITKLLKEDALKLRNKLNKEKITCKTKNKRLNFIIRFFDWVEKFYHYRFNDIFLLEHFRDYEIKRQKKKQLIVEFDDFKKIYQECNDEYYKLALLTMFIYGYRIGEQLALTVDSINFEDNTIEIYQSVNFKGGKGKKNFTLTTPKTASSERIQLMPTIYSTLIKEHIKRFKLKKKDFIFFRSEKEKNIPMHENTFRRNLETYCKAYNKEFHPHMLRASIVTHLKEKGVSLDEISKYLGHQETAITEQYYLKTSINKEKQINEVIEDFMKEIVSKEYQKKIVKNG